MQGYLCKLVGGNIFFIYMYFVITLLSDENNKIINFVDYSLNQGAPAGHESADTPIRHES